MISMESITVRRDTEQIFVLAPIGKAAGSRDIRWHVVADPIGVVMPVKCSAICVLDEWSHLRLRRLRFGIVWGESDLSTLPHVPRRVLDAFTRDRLDRGPAQRGEDESEVDR